MDSSDWLWLLLLCLALTGILGAAKVGFIDGVKAGQIEGYQEGYRAR
jgi:hypothetical protein